MFTSLSGYRTYILVGLGIVTVGLFYSGFITAGVEQSILTLLGFGTAAAIRAAIG